MAQQYKHFNSKTFTRASVTSARSKYCHLLGHCEHAIISFHYSSYDICDDVTVLDAVAASAEGEQLQYKNSVNQRKKSCSSTLYCQHLPCPQL